MSQSLANISAGILAVVVLIGLGMATSGQTLAPPPEWLMGWTSWLGTAVTIVLAPIGVIAAARALHKWALKN